MKYLTSLFFLFTVVCCVVVTGGCTEVIRYETPAKVAPVASEAATAAVVDLRSKTVALIDPIVDEPGHVRICSGVWIRQDVIATANHCVEDDALGAVEHYNVFGELGRGVKDALANAHVSYLARRDEDHDVALLVAGNVPVHAIADFAEPFAGEVVQTMGHPFGLWYSYSLGVIAAVRQGSGGLFVQSTAPISPGNSGGGVFNVDGELLGISSFYLDGGENLNFYVHEKYVHDLMKGMK